MESLNRTATELVDESLDFADELNVTVHQLDSDALVESLVHDRIRV